jgi:16S rRNA (guanine527-N7)-methyltransferase
LNVDVLPEEFLRLLEQAGYPLDAPALQRLQGHVDALRHWNPIASLVSEPALERLWREHVADSLTLLPALSAAVNVGATWWDIGSGGGFPAFSLKAARPELPLTCWERAEKKADILRKMADSARLGEVSVVTDQFSNRAPHPKGTVVLTARAVERPERMHPIFAGFMRPGDGFLCQREPVPRAFPPALFHVEHVEDVFAASGFRRGTLCRITRR